MGRIDSTIYFFLSGDMRNSGAWGREVGQGSDTVGQHTVGAATSGNPSINGAKADDLCEVPEGCADVVRCT